MHRSGKLLDPDGRTWRMVTRDHRTGSFERAFVQVFPDAAAVLAADRTASTAAAPVYLWALGALSFERWVMLSQRAVAAELGFGATTVGRALADLEERGFLERQGAGPRQEWRLTPMGAWRGTAAAYQRELRRRQGAEVVPLRPAEEPEGAA